MNSEIYILDEELSRYGETANFSQRAEALLNHQKKHWKLLNDNFNALNNIETNDYGFDSYYIRTQFNPSRIISSSAKVDRKSIAERACFLCEQNLPEVQRGINFKDEYIILCNPYPVFSQHLTIPYVDHIPQSIDSSFNALLELSFELKEKFFVFYNGPKCGASAPDHLHFQAGVRNSTPLEEYYSDFLKDGIELFSDSEIKIKLVDETIFKFVLMK
jgi:ATP adenylyltransferase/5',5'''-P-1,P-4-tetraphosphate phosphorylase II